MGFLAKTHTNPTVPHTKTVKTIDIEAHTKNQNPQYPTPKPTVPHSYPTANPTPKPTTHRQLIAYNYGISTETVRRWIRFTEARCFDWHKCNPGDKTPRFLHPYQLHILRWVLDHKGYGSDWVGCALLRNEVLTLNYWLEHQNSPPHS